MYILIMMNDDFLNQIIHSCILDEIILFFSISKMFFFESDVMTRFVMFDLISSLDWYTFLSWPSFNQIAAFSIILCVYVASLFPLHLHFYIYIYIYNYISRHNLREYNQFRNVSNQEEISSLFLSENFIISKICACVLENLFLFKTIPLPSILGGPGVATSRRVLSGHFRMHYNRRSMATDGKKVYRKNTRVQLNRNPFK